MERQPTFETTIFQNKITLWHIRLSMFIWKIKFTSYKQYFFGLLFSTNAKKTNADEILYKLFYFASKEASRKPLKVEAAKNFIPSVLLIDTTCINECLLFHVITANSIFLHKFIVTQRLDATAMLLWSLKQMFWKKSEFYVLVSTIILQWY